MKAPDLSSVDDAGVVAWSGSAEPLKNAATHANLKLSTAEFGHAKDRAALFAELDRALKLPEHFGHNWDALADVLEDRDWLGKTGRVIVFTGTAAYRRDHPTDYATLEDIFGEACEFWKERHVAFWVFTVK
jgi:RNAse (barnase) inhibitor barstar